MEINHEFAGAKCAVPVTSTDTLLNHSYYDSGDPLDSLEGVSPTGEITDGSVVQRINAPDNAPAPREHKVGRFNRVRGLDLHPGAVAVAGLVAALALMAGSVNRANASPVQPGEARSGLIGPTAPGAELGSAPNFIDAIRPETIRRQSGDLSGPVVQFFDFVGADSQQDKPNPNIQTYLHRVQAFANTRGDGFRFRIQTGDGQYSVPLIKLDESGAELASKEWPDVLTSVGQKIYGLGFNTMDNVNIVYVEGGKLKGCGSFYTNPYRTAVVSTGSNCKPQELDNKTHTYSYIDAIVAKSILTIAGIPATQIKGDVTSADLYNNPWDLWISRDHVAGYYFQLAKSPYLQHHLVIGQTGSGGGTITENIEPDLCTLDCGPAGSLLYPGGEEVIVTATADKDSNFRGWVDNSLSTRSLLQTGNTYRVDTTLDHSLVATFEAKQAAKKTYEIDARVTKGANLGSLVLNGERSDHIQKGYGTTMKGRVVAINLIPDQKKGAYVKSTQGCENSQVAKGPATRIGKCFFVVNEVIERANIAFGSRTSFAKN